MNRIYAATGKIEASHETDMEFEDFNRVMQNINNGNGKFLSFSDTDDRHIYINPDNVTFIWFEGGDVDGED